ncbi:MAG: TrmO family methyltransferase [Candidatus Odinarchaeota archaeon]
MSTQGFIIRPIGKVRVEGEDPKIAEYFLDIEKPYRSALKELDKWSHVIVLFWGHEMDKDEYRRAEDWVVDVPYGEGAPKTGIFATRAEYRPNPILMTTSAILNVDIKSGVVQLAGIDAFNGSPIIDLKAYFPICDRVRDAHTAPWLKEWPEYVEDGIKWWEEQGFFEDYE